MIKLKDLTQEERDKLSRNTERFFIVAKKSNHFKKAFNEVKDLVGKKNEDELWVLITATTQQLRYGSTSFTLPLSTNAYSKANSFTKQKISLTRMNEVIAILEEYGYIELYKGYYIPSTDEAMLSMIKPFEQWLDLFDVEVCKERGNPRSLSIVEINDRKVTYVSQDEEDEFGNVTKEKRKRKVVTKVPLETNGVKGVTRVRKELKGYNVQIESSIIKINGQVVNNIVYKRVFYKNLFLHGRWHTLGGFQSTSKLNRRTITIDDEPTCEVDLQSCQPSTLYSWNNIKKPDNLDPYTIELEELCYDTKELRKLCKVAMLCILFNDTKKQASGAIVEKINKDKLRTKVDKKNPNRKRNQPEFKSLHKVEHLTTKLISKLLKHNSSISNHFFTGNLWAKLQFVDGSICEYVINHFTSKGITVLSIHDSWVIKSKHKEELIDVMKKAWVHVVRDEGMNFGYDVEFEN